MLALPDVNVLVALAWPTHVHHERAHQWLSRQGDAPWATCPLTESGFVRVSSNTAAIPGAKTPREAIQLLEAILERPHHVFVADDVSIADSRHVAIDRLTGHRQVTDAHLLGVALKSGAQLITLDRSLPSLVPSGFERTRVAVIA